MSNYIIFIERSCLCDNSISKGNLEWKPLLLIVPLRLGLNEINPIYVPGLQVNIININKLS